MNSSYVVQLMQLAATGDTCGCYNADVFNQAVELMDCSDVSEFEEVTPLLIKNECDASAVFGHPVTNETHDAFAAYLCFCVNS